MNPTDCNFFVLESMPGKTFRRLWDEQGDEAAIQYTRRFVDQCIYGAPPPISDVLGTTTFNPKFRDLLNVIPIEQIVSVEALPIGTGARGTVYKGIWRCPRKIHMEAEEERPVALKVMHGGDIAARTKFLQEVR